MESNDSATSYFGRYIFCPTALLALSRLSPSLTQYASVLQQADDTQIYFTDVYWPEFGLWEFIPILFDYQRKVWAGALGAHRQNKAVAATAAAAVM